MSEKKPTVSVIIRPYGYAHLVGLAMRADVEADYNINRVNARLVEIYQGSHWIILCTIANE